MGTSTTEPSRWHSLTPSRGVKIGTANSSKTSNIAPQAKNTCQSGSSRRDACVSARGGDEKGAAIGGKPHRLRHPNKAIPQTPSVPMPRVGRMDIVCGVCFSAVPVGFARPHGQPCPCEKIDMRNNYAPAHPRLTIVPCHSDPNEAVALRYGRNIELRPSKHLELKLNPWNHLAFTFQPLTCRKVNRKR